MQKNDLLYEGRAKKVFTTDDPDLLLVDYRQENIAAYDEKKDAMVTQAAINNRMTNYIFRMLEEKGIPTHYVQELSDRETVVKKVEIIPLKVIIRNIAAGSFSRILGMEEGLPLLSPTLEFNYKNRELGDPMINDYYAIAIGAATREELDRMTELAFRINEELKEFFLEKGISLVDLKMEFGRYKGQIILADEISPETCRFRDAGTNEKLESNCTDSDDLSSGAYQIMYKQLGL